MEERNTLMGGGRWPAVLLLSTQIVALLVSGCPSGADASKGSGSAGTSVWWVSTRIVALAVSRYAKGADASTDADATGTLLRGPLPNGYEQIGATDPDAKGAVESGGIFLRKTGDEAGAVIGAAALPGLSLDPTDPEICSDAATRTSKATGQSLLSAEVIGIGGKRVCFAEFGKPGTKLVGRSYTWILDTPTKLGVMASCAIDPSDEAEARACVAFVSGVSPART